MKSRRAHGLLPLALAAALAACGPAPAGPSTGASAGPGGTAASVPPGGGGASSAPVTTGVSGTLRAPVAAQVDALGGYALAALQESPAANVSVAVLDAAGATLAGGATTDAGGAYSLATLPPGAAMLQAKLHVGSRDLTMAAAISGNRVDIDAASTLVAKKIQAMIALKGADASAFAGSGPGLAAEALRRVLTPLAAVAGAVGDTSHAAAAFDSLVGTNAALAGQLAGDTAASTWLRQTPALPLIAPPPPPTGQVRTLAGTPGLSGSDGAGSRALLAAPGAVVRDNAGHLYVADTRGNAIRVINTQDAAHTVTTLAGSGLAGYADGQGQAAQFNAPSGLALDAAGNLYVADRGNQRIRKVAPDGSVSTLAGSGAADFRDGSGDTAAFHDPLGLAIKADGTLFVADSGNLRIRQVTPDGTVSTLAGSGGSGSADGPGASATFSSLGGLVYDPDVQGGARLYATDGNLLRAVLANGQVIRVAGNSPGSADGPGNLASFLKPTALALDLSSATHTVVVADTGNNGLRRVDPGGTVTTAAAGGTLNAPAGVAVAADGTIYVADTGNARVVSVNGQQRTELLAGASVAPRRDGHGTSALFGQPRFLLVDKDGSLLVSDAGDDVIRRVTAAGDVTTYAGSGSGDAEGTFDTMQFRGPAGLCRDAAGNLYVVETAANRVRKLEVAHPDRPSSSVLAGNGNDTSPLKNGTDVDGTGSLARFVDPRGMAIGPDGLLYVADAGNHRVRTIDPATGQVDTYVGTDARGSADGTRTSATFDTPVGVAFDKAGTLYVTDAGAHRLRKITHDGQVSTLAGHLQGDTDGQGLQAAFNTPAGLAVNADGVVFVADAGNRRIRKVTPDGTVSTVGGSGFPGLLDGLAWLSRFVTPNDVAIGSSGQLYVTDVGSATIRELDF